MSVLDSLPTVYSGLDILRTLGFIWLGDLLRLRAHTLAYVAPYKRVQLNDAGEPVLDVDGEEILVECWKAHDHHGLKISGFLTTREEAVLAAETWVAKRHELLLIVAFELASLRQARAEEPSDTVVRPSRAIKHPIRVEKEGPTSFSADLINLAGSPPIGRGRSVGEAIGVLVQIHAETIGIDLQLSEEAVKADSARWSRHYNANR